MRDEELKKRLAEIAALASQQRHGAFGVESNALTALMLVEKLSLLLVEEIHTRPIGDP